MENSDIITQMTRHRKVVRRHEEGETEIFANPSQEQEQLGSLHRVESLGEPMANEQLRFGEEGSRQRDLLALDRIEFHRIEIPDRLGQPDRDHDRFDTMVPLLARLAPVPDPEHLAKRFRDGHAGRQLTERIGKNRLETTTHATKRPVGKGGEVYPAKNNPSRGDRLEFHKRQTQREQTAPIPPDEAEATTRLQSEAEIFDENLVLHAVLEPAPSQTRTLQSEIFQFQEFHEGES